MIYTKNRNLRKLKDKTEMVKLKMKSNMRKRLNLWHANKRSKWEDLRLVKEYKRLKGVCEIEVQNAVQEYEKIKLIMQKKD